MCFLADVFLDTWDSVSTRLWLRFRHPSMTSVPLCSSLATRSLMNALMREYSLPRFSCSAHTSFLPRLTPGYITER